MKRSKKTNCFKTNCFRKSTAIGKRIALCAIAGLLTVGTLSGCSNGSGSEDEVNFSVWVGKGEDSQYYSDYTKNPILETYYFPKKYTGKDGKEISVSLDFQIPAAGTEKDNIQTLIATGDYTDIMDMDYYSGSITDLYEEGIVLDITEYVENHMPNYMAWLDANPELALTATNIVDGEKRYLCIRTYNTYVEQWQGFEYRRDWIVKYGENPNTGEGFTGAYADASDTTTWEDDVVFPSGGMDPKYISDWEWMFEIFEIAIAAEGITGGYCISLPYKGYSEIAFGGDSDHFRAYLQCVNEWYKRGWIDQAFAEHASDLPWRIDEVNVRQGKVGMMSAGDSQFMNKMNTGDENTKDIIVFAAPYPINDIYGSESAKNVEPFSLYQMSAEGKMFVVTDKAEKKDLVALFSFIDFMYAEENAVKNAYGYTKEEYEEYQPEFCQHHSKHN